MKANTWKITRILTCPDRAGHEVHFDFNEQPRKVLITDQVDLVQNLARMLAGEFELHAHPGLGGWVELVSPAEQPSGYSCERVTPEEKAAEAAKPIDVLKVAKALIASADCTPDPVGAVALLQEARQWIALQQGVFR